MQEHYAALQQEDVGLVVASVDPLQDAKALAQELQLDFPLAWGLVSSVTAELLGCFFEPDKSYLHATGFIIAPDGSIAVACYSTGPVGRLQPDNALKLIRHWKSQG